MKGLAIVVFLISIVSFACVKRSEPAGEEQGLGAVAGDSAKGLVKILSGASDDVVMTMRKFVDDSEVDKLVAIVRGGGKKADEAGMSRIHLVVAKKKKR